MLLPGLQLQLPRLVASNGHPGHVSIGSVLTAIITVTDLTGGLRTGVLPAEHLRWQLIPPNARTRRDSGLVREPRRVTPSTA